MGSRSIAKVNLADGGGAESTAQLINGATATNGDPSAATDGVAARDAEWLMLVASSAGGTCTLKLWEYDQSSATWAQNTDLGSWSFTSGQEKRARVQIAGADRVYVEIDAVAGATIDVWAVGLYGV